MLLLKRTYLFILALAIAIFAVPRDEMLWLWATVLLTVLGVINLRRDQNITVKKASNIALLSIMIVGAIVAVAVIIYFWMMQGFINGFDR